MEELAVDRRVAQHQCHSCIASESDAVTVVRGIITAVLYTREHWQIRGMIIHDELTSPYTS